MNTSEGFYSVKIQQCRIITFIQLVLEIEWNSQIPNRTSKFKICSGPNQSELNQSHTTWNSVESVLPLSHSHLTPYSIACLSVACTMADTERQDTLFSAAIKGGFIQHFSCRCAGCADHRRNKWLAKEC